jgi:hypothetical protein
MSTSEHAPFVAPPGQGRESACPVHFVWDGRGVGRPLVRAGFMGFLVTGAFVTAAVMLHSTVLRDAAAWILGGSALAWALGQAATFLRRRR